MHPGVHGYNGSDVQNVHVPHGHKQDYSSMKLLKVNTTRCILLQALYYSYITVKWIDSPRVQCSNQYQVWKGDVSHK